MATSKATSKGIQLRANDQIVISIYNNICNEFIKYRKLELNDPFMERKTLSEEIFKKGYIIIKTSMKNNNSKTEWLKNVYIVFYHFLTSEMLKAADIKKIIQITNNMNGSSNPYDIILITQNSISTHIHNFIKEHQNKEKIIDAGRQNKLSCLFEHDEINCNCNRNNIYSYTYSNFIITVPKHILVPKYRVLTKEEREKVVNELFTKKSKLPKIKRIDPCVVWSHAIAGDVIEFERNDEVTGSSIYYRLVV